MGSNKNRYTEEELTFLKENYTKLGGKKCSEILGRPYDSVQKTANNMGIRQYKYKKWTKEEEDFIREHFPRKGSKYCAEHLDRGITAVQKKAQQLGVKHEYGDKFYVDSQGYIIYIDKEYKHHYLHRILMEQHLGRKLSSDEIIHHIDGNKKNNDISNLEITTRSEHINMHREDLVRGQWG